MRKKQLSTYRGYVICYFFLNQLVLRRLFWAYICIFSTLFQETYVPDFIARHYMLLFRCLVTLRIRGKSVGRVSFDTGNNRLLEREKQSHILLFRIQVVNCRYFPFGFEGRIWDLIVSVPDHCLSFYSAIVDLMLIQSA